MGTVTLQLNEQPSADELRQIIDGVRVYNRAIGGMERPRSIATVLRDDEGRIVGGAHGELWGRSMHIAALWVDESQRGHGHGTALMGELERCAASKGHSLAYVETLSFQARPFYESLGYQVYGVLDGVADGCTLFFLKKDLKVQALPKK